MPQAAPTAWVASAATTKNSVNIAKKRRISQTNRIRVAGRVLIAVLFGGSEIFDLTQHVRVAQHAFQLGLGGICACVCACVQVRASRRVRQDACVRACVWERVRARVRTRKKKPENRLSAPTLQNALRLTFRNENGVVARVAAQREATTRTWRRRRDLFRRVAHWRRGKKSSRLVLKRKRALELIERQKENQDSRQERERERACEQKA